MRWLAWMLLLFFVFTIPWEYSLNFGPPFGNIARLSGLALLFATVPAILQSGHIRPWRTFHFVIAAWLVWLCCTALWSIDPRDTLSHLPGYFQEIMIVWLAWELIETEQDLTDILHAYVAGVLVLSVLTLASFFNPGSPGQVRFVPEGQDPNDVARFLVMGLPFAAWLADRAAIRTERAFALAVLPVASVAVLLTASRGGFLACILSLGGCALLLRKRHLRSVILGVAAVPLTFAAVWLTAPHETLLRLGSIPEQLLGGDLNQRWNIWAAGWSAFVRAPFIGWGAGSFVSAAHTAPVDTAHNAALAIAVEGGLISLALAGIILLTCLRSLMRVSRPLRLALGTAFAAWIFLSSISNVQENRTTWLLLGLIAASERFFEPASRPRTLAYCTQVAPIEGAEV